MSATSAWVSSFFLIAAAWMIVSGYTSINAVVKAELFPTAVRATGVGLPYAITVSIFGGTVDSVALWFKSIGHETWFYYYLTGCIAFSLIVYVLMRDTKKHSAIVGVPNNGHCSDDSGFNATLLTSSSRACRGTHVTYAGDLAVGAFVYILRCSDGSYYVGSTRGSLEDRVEQHQAGIFGGYTARRRPVQLLFDQEFDRITDAIAAERQLKNWSRAKKEALIQGDFEALPYSVCRICHVAFPHLRPSTSSG